jgi:outer membrane protein W
LRSEQEVDPKNNVIPGPDLIPEATWYVASRLAVFTGVGASYALARKEVADETASGSSIGAILAFGADVSFNADWNARATLAYRQGLTDADLSTNSGGIIERGGSLSSLQLALSAGYIF